MSTKAKEQVLATIDAKREKIFELCKWLYDHPEIALEEKESSRKVADFLKDEGFDVEMDPAGMQYSFKAVKKNGEGPKICIFAEYDALPNIGHGCGHNLIASISTLAGIGLAAALSEYTGEVAVIGTPAEETGHGKSYMTDHGVFDGYDAGMMIHPNNITDIYPDFIAISGIDYVFEGKASHAGGNPSDGINAMDAVVLFLDAIGLLRQQLRDGTRVHGIIQEAGKAANVIPDLGRVRIEFRSDDMDYFNNVVERVNNCAKGAALATGCKLSYDWFEPTCYNLKHNHVLAETITKHLVDMGVEMKGERVGRGSTDLGNTSQVIPCIQPMVKCCDTELGIHTEQFRDATLSPYAQERLIVCAKALALTGLDCFENPELLVQAKEEFAKK